MEGTLQEAADDVLPSQTDDCKMSVRKKKVHFEDDANLVKGEAEEDSVVHMQSIPGGRYTHSSIMKGKDGVKRLEKMDKKLQEKRRIYSEEKAELAKKLEETKASFNQEIKKYERDLQEKRQDYLTQLDNLKMDEQVSSIGKRMEELEQLEKGLNSRLEHFLEYEKEIQEFEGYLSRRQELCQRQEYDLERQKEKLDTLHEELEADRFNLEEAGFDTSKMGTKQTRRSHGLETTAEEDYILKANLRKCQFELAKATDQTGQQAKEIELITKELQQEKEENRKQAQKIKHLESQLSIYISMNRSGSDHHSIRSFGSKVSQDGDQARTSRTTSRSNATLERLNTGQLSINQEAQMRHNLNQRSGRSSSKDQNQNKYLPRKHSVDSGRGSSQITVDTNGKMNDEIGKKDFNSRVCTVL
ncbi:putative intracellular protein transport protein USO1 [Apostichopus japonicus]|uniref:Putative intracellular protein transport protein USO1 n=1 Tax=Stichopus japonicus TaxID=307972 RepID=A0A2G8JTP7_STIJA|nr:putative intracellular protein transport protein USO1 [Apostichopus japonicus]